MVRGRKETLFYSGDVCFHDQTILRGARFEDVKADVLIMETTRGNRELAPGFSRAGEIERLSNAILRVLQRPDGPADGADIVLRRPVGRISAFRNGTWPARRRRLPVVAVVLMGVRHLPIVPRRSIFALPPRCSGLRAGLTGTPGLAGSARIGGGQPPA
jgi:hypothetical protein